MTAVLHIRLLGDFSLHYGETPVTGVHTPRLQSLLAYLLLHREAPQFRAHLAFQFWPDSTEAQAHSNLRTLLHRLRRALPDANRFLAIDGQALQWRPGAPFSLDVADFEAALTRAEGGEQAGDEVGVREALKRAIALYEGDLLPSCYDDWILTARERLHQRYLDALEGLIRRLEAGRDYDGAIRYARRLLRDDPLHEAAYRRLMRLRGLSGDRAGALRVYHTCVTMLHRELGVAPSTATQRAYEQLLQVEDRPVPAARMVPAVSPLVGRAGESAQLQAAWRAAAARRPRFVLLLGEAGIGKTRLVEELLDWAGRQGIERAYARCYAAEGELAYAPVTALLRARPLPALDDVWLGEVARLLPEALAQRPELSHPRPMTEAWQRGRLFEALARAVLGDGQPLLVAIDDLHWCDRETLEWLHFLLRFDPQARLLVVGTCRPEELDGDCPFSGTLPALHRDVRLVEVELGPLDECETATLAANVADQALEPAVMDHLYCETEGNPLFVVEMVRAGLEGGSWRMEDGRWKVEVGDGHARPQVRPLSSNLQALPPRVQAVLEARLAQLSPLSQGLAGLAATIGRAFTFLELRAVSDGDEDALVGGLDELWQRRIVRERGAEAYDFTHDKLREAAYAALSPARRRLLHRRVAQALESIHSSDLDPVSRQVASHYRQAGLSEQAIPHYLRAGQVASQVYAIDDAEACFRRGLALLAEGAWDASKRAWRREMAARLYEGLGDTLKLSQPEEARLAYHSALQETDQGDLLAQARLQGLIGTCWYHQGQFDRALQAFDQAETTLGEEPLGPAPGWWREWLDIQVGRAYVYYYLARWQEMEELAARAQPAAERYGTPVQRAWFASPSVTMAMRRDRYLISDETLVSARTALSEIQKTGDLPWVAISEYILGWVLLLRGDLDEAEEHLRAALALSNRIEYALVRAYALTWMTVLCRKRGQVEGARGYAPRALVAGIAAGQPEQVAMAHANLSWIAWREGNLAEAEELGLAALDSWQRGQFVYAFHWTARFPLLAMALEKEGIPEALGHARAMLDPQQQQLPEPLEAALEEAVQAGEQDLPTASSAHLRRAVELAQKLGYL